MPSRRKAARRSTARTRTRGAVESPAELSRTPTPAQESEQDETVEAGDEAATPIQQADGDALNGEQDNDEDDEDADEGDGENGADDGEEDDNTEGATKSRRLATPSRASSEQTPARRRGGFRGGTAWRGRNWKAKGPPNVQQHPIDLEGNPATIVNDEVLLPEDPEGEKKVDEFGHLNGGREYRVRTFTVEGKGERLYMLSTEPARCIGFRDSYLFFQKHRQLAKIVLSEDEKHDLISRHLIPHSYKGRNIGVVTARSVFREFGARIVIGGRRIIDDYQVTAAREAGDIEGEIAVPEDRVPTNGEEYDRKRYVAWHGASAVYHSNAPAVGGVLQPIQNSLIHPSQGALPKRRKIHVTGSNWMLEHARAASNFNSLLTSLRSANKNGQYDIYTNTMHYPSIYQHTHARWEAISSDTPSDTANTTSNTANSTPLTSTSTPPLTPSSSSLTSTSTSTSSPFPPSPAEPASYPTVTPYLLRNAVTVDTCFAEPTTSTLGIPGISGVDGWGLGSKGLVDVDEDVLACLDERCRADFERAREEERAWRMSWRNEQVDAARRTGIVREGMLRM